MGLSSQQDCKPIEIGIMFFMYTLSSLLLAMSLSWNNSTCIADAELIHEGKMSGFSLWLVDAPFTNTSL